MQINPASARYRVYPILRRSNHASSQFSIATMTSTTTISHHPLTRVFASASLTLQRWTDWLEGEETPATQQHLRESAAMLYARAAEYEATQPGFASDLRAAAEATDRLASQRSR